MPDPTPTLDLETITLGEMAEVERQSRRSFDELMLAGRASRQIAALFLVEWRSSGNVPSWSEISSRPVSGGASSTSASPSAGRRPRSPR